MKKLWNGLRASQMHRFAAKFAGDALLNDYPALHKRSVEDIERFWVSFLLDSGIVYEGELEPVLKKTGTAFFECSWFPETRLNYAENLLKQLPDTALVGLYEEATSWNLSREEVLGAVAAFQKLLKEAGLKKGDVVAACVPHCPEAVLVMLAASSLGLLWTSVAPDFAVQGILDRFAQVNPKFLLLCSESLYAGKRHDYALKNKELVSRLGVSSFLEFSPYQHKQSAFWQALKIAIPDFESGLEPEFLRLPFSHPLFILYSSGTTGAPKCIVHSAGGTLIQHRKEHRLHGELRAEDRILYFTTCGWMMWNWVCSSLAEGATLYCYDGSPMHPHPEALFEWTAKEQLTHLGVSARYIAALSKAALKPCEKYELKNLRCVYSTGSPLQPEDYDYFYAAISPDNSIQLASICGGTDIVSCFMLGNPMSAVYRGEIQGPGLGMDVQALDENGIAQINQKAELVCAQPFPSMPLGFWGDHDNSRFKAAYFERFPGYWHHGDFVEIKDNLAVVVYGRSDTTLNPGGVRIGSAEIYRAVETLPEYSDSFVVGFPSDGDEKIILFLCPSQADAAFAGRDPAAVAIELPVDKLKSVSQRIRELCSPRHTPWKAYLVPELPYTRSGKKVELAVKGILQGQEVQQKEALSNPDSLKFFEAVAVALRGGA